jgi:hypothetical protein
MNGQGVLEAALTVLILVLAWPQRTLREASLRLVFALPLIALLTAIDAPLDFLGNLHQLAMRRLDPLAFQPLYAWAQFLEGGGDLALALASSAIAIGLGAKAASPPLRSSSVSDAAP